MVNSKVLQSDGADRNVRMASWSKGGHHDSKGTAAPRPFSIEVSHDSIIPCEEDLVLSKDVVVEKAGQMVAIRL